MNPEPASQRTSKPRVSTRERGYRRGYKLFVSILKPSIHAGFKASLERFYTKVKEVQKGFDSSSSPFFLSDHQGLWDVYRMNAENTGTAVKEIPFERFFDGFKGQIVPGNL